MVNTLYLEQKIKESGKKKEFIARICGITRQSLMSKCKNKSQFTVDQVAAICRELNITSLEEKDYIFFNNELKESST